MRRLVLLVLLVLLLPLGLARAEEATFLGLSADGAHVTLRLRNAERAYELQGVKIYNSAGNEVRPDWLRKLPRNTRIEVKFRDANSLIQINLLNF
jgi:hypothetical protein